MEKKAIMMPNHAAAVTASKKSNVIYLRKIFLVIDEKVVSYGKVLKPEDIAKIIEKVK